jgi:hypothetical protein
MMPRLPKALLRICLCVFVCAQMSHAQDAPPNGGERDHAAERADYHRSGRTAKGENAADLLHRAYRKKMALRQAALKQRQEASRASGERPDA